MNKKFNKEELDLVYYLLENEKSLKWLELAQKFNIEPELTETDRAKAASLVWRKFLSHIKRKDLTLETAKQIFDREGNLLFETKKLLPREEHIDTRGFMLKEITTNPHGGNWKKYKKVVDIEEVEYIYDRLFEKYKGKQLHIDLIGEKQFYYGNQDLLGVINLYDAHLDKIPLKSTCGVESTLEKNLEIFHRTVDKIINKSKLEKINTVILPLGNDLFHTNGFDSKTKKGTELEYFGSPEEAYYAISDAVVETVLKLKAHFAKVEVLMIKGNHDEDKVTTLGYWLEKMFKSIKNVNIDRMRNQRKYYQFGENLLGFAHGDKEKRKIQQLPLFMAQEEPKMWGNTTYRKMFLGDLHHGFEYQFLKTKDQPGVEVEYLRSVGTTDTWHQDFGWIGVPKTGYLQIFHRTEGEITRHKFNVK